MLPYRNLSLGMVVLGLVGFADISSALAGHVRMNFFAKTIRLSGGNTSAVKVGNFGLSVPESDGPGRVLVEFQVSPVGTTNGDIICKLKDSAKTFELMTVAPQIAPKSGTNELIGSQNSPVPSPLVTKVIHIKKGGAQLMEIECVHAYGAPDDSFNIVGKATFVPDEY